MSIRKMTILLVDDDDTLRHLLSLVLTKSGYTVRSAHDGFSALAELRVNVPDVLLSDLYMPDMTGFELLSVVRRRFPQIAVIAMSSAYSGPGVPVGIAADAFYPKATHLQGLLGRVSDVGRRTGRSATRRNAATPVWIPRNTDDSEATEIALGCTDCLRTFFEVPEDDGQVIREVDCMYCSTRIQYAMVQAAGFGRCETVPLEVTAD
jgi:DNA-binding response OmpR family regulator